MQSESEERDSKPHAERLLCDSRREEEENKSEHAKSDSASIQIIDEDSSSSLSAGPIKIKQPDPVSEVEKDTPQTAIGLTKTNRNAGTLKIPMVGFDAHYEVKFEDESQGQKEIVDHEEKHLTKQKLHNFVDNISGCRSPICDYRDVFSTVREQVIAMTSQGEAIIKSANLSEETQNNQKSTLKKVNKVVLENLTALLDSLLFQSGLSKQDSVQILSKLFVTHSPPLNTQYNASKSH
jgi:hypothetical protein